MALITTISHYQYPPMMLQELTTRPGSKKSHCKESETVRTSPQFPSYNHLQQLIFSVQMAVSSVCNVISLFNLERLASAIIISIGLERVVGSWICPACKGGEI